MAAEFWHLIGAMLGGYGGFANALQLTRAGHQPSLTIMLLLGDEAVKNNHRVRRIDQKRNQGINEKHAIAGCFRGDVKQDHGNEQAQIKQAMHNVAKIEMMNANGAKHATQRNGCAIAFGADFATIISTPSWGVAGRALFCGKGYFMPAMGAKIPCALSHWFCPLTRSN
jgi:uncharacterized protein YukE